METGQFFDRRYCAQYVTGTNGIRYFSNLTQKSSVIGTFNRDGSGIASILLKFAGLYDVIVFDRCLSSITKRLALRVI